VYRSLTGTSSPITFLSTRTFALKIIDSDIAMQVKDEEVDDHCGTEHWKAPKVEKKSRHTPIKADRCACGHILLYRHDKFRRGTQAPDRAFATNLKAYNPKQRPSLLGYFSYGAPLPSDVGNVWNDNERKALRLRRDPMEVDRETTKPPNAKKQRLDGPGQNEMSGTSSSAQRPAKTP
jgi:hypothetical protein